MRVTTLDVQVSTVPGSDYCNWITRRLELEAVRTSNGILNLVITLRGWEKQVTSQHSISTKLIVGVLPYDI